ncbi:PQQ-binding-like beta-propeller repeat protein [Proteobacteria bacterium 005FR1]|nr:PQQ-binding-like beta-propeller repeat protein [Proteobacteria bacterium 005FR1]
MMHFRIPLNQRLRDLALAAAICLFAQSAVSQPQSIHPGEKIYQQTCAGCHDNPEATRAPGRESLQAMRRSTVDYAMTLGYMKIQAKNLSEKQREQLLDWLGMEQQDNTAWLDAAMCKGDQAIVDKNASGHITSFGIDSRNLRRLSAEQSGLRKKEFADLELVWAFGFPQTPTMRSQPVIAGDTLFIASTDAGRLYALNTETACVKWMYEADYPLRSSLSYGKLENGSPVVVTGDAAGAVLTIDARSGKPIWRTDIRLHEANRITGTPVIHEGRVYAPLSGVEINYAGDDTYECCKTQGAVIALDLESGKKLWTGRTMEPASRQKISRAGTQLWGPSGAPIWSTPVIDEKRNRLYVGTGENNSLPVTGTSDAIIAFNLDTGERDWVFQATERDAWNYACTGGANCDWGGKAIIVDHDFGGSVMITQRKDGRDLLVVGQKSGTTWALDPDKNGELVWSTKIGSGGFLGGNHWGTASDGERVFVPLNDRSPTPDRPDGRPGMYALDLETGEIIWSHQAKADCSGDRKQRFPACDARLGYSPVPLVVDGAVLQGSIDGILRVFDGASGDLLWKYDTVKSFETVNGVPGQGGALDSAPYVAADGTLYVMSGYSRFGQAPGNVLLAFRPKP